jgi:hypothetical protein
MARKTKRRIKHVETHRQRALLTVAARQDTGDPIPNIDWFAAIAQPTVRELINEGLLTDNDGIRLTAAGRRHLRPRAMFVSYNNRDEDISHLVAVLR